MEIRGIGVKIKIVFQFHFDNSLEKKNQTLRYIALNKSHAII